MPFLLRQRIPDSSGDHGYQGRQYRSDSPGWQLQSCPMKFPALQIEGNLDRRGIGIYDLTNGIGAHEVIIETPYHNKDLSDLLNPEIENLITMCSQRTLDLLKDKRFKCIMIFKNYGPAAGASLRASSRPDSSSHGAEEKNRLKLFEYREC